MVTWLVDITSAWQEKCLAFIQDEQTWIVWNNLSLVHFVSMKGCSKTSAIEKYANYTGLFHTYTFTLACGAIIQWEKVGLYKDYWFLNYAPFKVSRHYSIGAKQMQTNWQEVAHADVMLNCIRGKSQSETTSSNNCQLFARCVSSDPLPGLTRFFVNFLTAPCKKKYEVFYLCGIHWRQRKQAPGNLNLRIPQK